MNVQDFLRDHDVSFDRMKHWPTYDAQHLAQAVHVSGERVAKTVLLRADDGYVLAVLPATRIVDLHLARKALGADRVVVASETECGARFTDCELGSLPPFGSQYHMRTLLDQNLLHDDEIVFNSNRHDEAIRMSLRDFKELEQPLVAAFSRRG